LIKINTEQSGHEMLELLQLALLIAIPAVCLVLMYPRFVRQK